MHTDIPLHIIVFMGSIKKYAIELLSVTFPTKQLTSVKKTYIQQNHNIQKIGSLIACKNSVVLNLLTFKHHQNVVSLEEIFAVSFHPLQTLQI